LDAIKTTIGPKYFTPKEKIIDLLKVAGKYLLKKY